MQSALFTNPSLSFSARALEGGGRANLSFGLAQELVDLWQIPVRKRIAKDKLESTVLGVAAAGIDLAAHARTAYVQLRVQQELEVLAQANLDLIRHTLELTQRRFDAGETTILDVNLIQSSVLDGTMKLSAARKDTSLARTELGLALGLPPEQGRLEAAEALADTVLESGDDTSLVRNALERRLDVRMASLDLDAAAEEIRHQKRSAFPSVTLGIDGERPDLPSTHSQTSLASQIATLDTLAASPSQALRDRIVDHIDGARQHKQDKADAVDLLLGPSLQMTLPIFDQNQAQTAKARFLHAQQQKSYEQLLLTVARDVLDASANARASAEQLKIVRDEALPLADRNVATAQRVYEAGEESVLVLLLAQQNLNSQRESRIKIAGEYAVAQAELERVTGGKPEPAEPQP